MSGGKMQGKLKLQKKMGVGHSNWNLLLPNPTSEIY